MIKKNIIYIFGAGASKDFGLPLGYEIFHNADKIIKPKNPPIAKDELTDAFKEVEKNMHMIFLKLPKSKIKYAPFEEVLTFIWESKKSERPDSRGMKLISLFKHKKGAEGVFNIFVKMLGLTLSIDMSFLNSKSEIKILKKYIASIDFTHQNVSFISLNYDLIIDRILLECAKEKIIKGYSYGYKFDNITKGFHNNKFIDHHHKILLLKPHGSLNLAYCAHPHEMGFYYHDQDFFISVESLGDDPIIY